MSKWLNGPCYVEIELRSGILEVKNLQKELSFMILLLFVMKLGLNHISASGHIGFEKYGGLLEHLLRRPKNAFIMFWSTYMPNFMLVDKSAKSSLLVIY